MHKIPKNVVRVGVVILLVGVILLQYGSGRMGLETSPESENWSGTLFFEGTTNSSVELELTFGSVYNVFVEEGTNVSVEILSGSDTIEYEECSDDCDLYDIDGHIEGYQYIGDIDFIDEDPFSDSGTYEIKITEENGQEAKVMIREDKSFSGFILAAAGISSCCFGAMLLLTGGLLTLKFKEELVVIVDQTHKS